jgi:hypothetical protein
MTEELSDYEKQQAAEERRRARIYAEEEGKIVAKQKQADDWANIKRMGPFEYAAFARRANAEGDAAKKAAADAKAQAGNE